MNKVYIRTENGTSIAVTIADAMSEVNYAMMDGKQDVQEMSSGSGRHEIKYKNGRRVLLVLEDFYIVEDEPEDTEVDLTTNVISYNGGKVHTAMPGLSEADFYPLCRGGGMNQNLTKFRVIIAPLTCKTCLTYADRRTAR